MEQNINKQGNIRRLACLGCGQRFRSEGPFQRICPSCKESEEWQRGDSDVVLHPPRPAANDNDEA